MPLERVAKIKALLQEKAEQATNARPLFWKPAGLLRRVSPARHIQEWLRAQGSLTAKLRAIGPDLEVLVLSEQLERPLANEAHALGLPAHEEVWVRCVVLKGHERSWVYARTIIPNFNEQNPWFHLNKLGNKPLGEVLFQDNSIKRTPFVFASQRLETWPYLISHLGNQQAKKPGYARRSTFTKEGCPLLLTEVFLPGLLTITG